MLSSLLLIYVWAGYPVLLWLLGRLVVPPDLQEQAEQPLVSVIIAAHNEEHRIRTKLENCQRFAYPPEKIEILVASDGSTDQTEAIVEELGERDPRIRLLRSVRVGKSEVQNLAAQQARGEVLFFTDANARVKTDALRFLVGDLADPSVGLVSAEALFGSPEDAVSRGQGFYWRFELFLRRAESDLGILATTSARPLRCDGNCFGRSPFVTVTIASRPWTCGCKDTAYSTIGAPWYSTPCRTPFRASFARGYE